MSDNMAQDLESAVRSVTKDWKRAKRQADKADRVRQSDLDRMRDYRPPRTSIRDAAFEVMEQAFNHASNHGKYHANARQIMYAARPLVIEITDGEIWKDSSYFTQTLLKDYLEQYQPTWARKVVWDARGHFTEPHEGDRIGLGGIEVMKYRRQWTDGTFAVCPYYDPPVIIGTVGPKLRYSAVLFLEKEGFDPILQDARIADRWDVAIMSTKGIPVKAASDLLSGLSGVQVLVVHDFDVDGFKIVNTLRTGTRLAQGTEVTDLGFRLADVQGLLTEKVEQWQTSPEERLRWDYDAADEEIDFLVRGSEYSWNGRWHWWGERVELNAMTTEQFIDWLERKLDEAGVAKVVPDGETLQRAYQRAYGLREVQKAQKEVAARVAEAEYPVPSSNELDGQVRELLQSDRTLSWDETIWQLLED